MKIISSKKWNDIQGELLAEKKEKQQLLTRVATLTKDLTQSERREGEAKEAAEAANKTAKIFEGLCREEKEAREKAESKAMELDARISKSKPAVVPDAVQAETELRKSNAAKTTKKNAAPKKKA